MRNIGIVETQKHLDEEGERILGVIHSLGLNRNKVVIVHGGDSPLDIGNINEIKKIETLPFACWRVIAVGAYWVEATVADDKPILEFGRVGDPDAYGKVVATVTGGEKFNIADHTKYDPLELAAPEVQAEASATFTLTWTQGAEFGVWNSVIRDLEVAEAAVLAMTSGQVRPYMLIEVDTGGKW